MVQVESRRQESLGHLIAAGNESTAVRPTSAVGAGRKS